MLVLMVILKAFKYRLYPNVLQQELLARHFGCARMVYNHFLRQRMDFYAKHRGEKKQGLTYPDTSRMLTELKRRPDFVWLNAVNAQSLQQALKDLDAAHQNFFAGRARYPRFKHKRDKQSFRIPQGFKLDEQAGRLLLPKLPPLRIVLHRPLQGTLRSVTVSRRPSGR
jgi:putative transposase